ncbi:MAG: Holliday junction resolvase RuvX [bacterium]|nr:Holliday junction resolvase RuvX [bacterium]
MKSRIHNEYFVIAIDPGTKRWGVAIGELNTKQVFQMYLFEHGYEENFKQLEQLIHHYKIKAIVVGYPTYLDGKKHSMSFFVDELCAHLKRFDIPVRKVDERLSSFVVEEELKLFNVKNRKKKKLIDKLSAKLILEDAFRENILDDLIQPIE